MPQKSVCKLYCTYITKKISPHVILLFSKLLRFHAEEPLIDGLCCSREFVPSTVLPHAWSFPPVGGMSPLPGGARAGPWCFWMWWEHGIARQSTSRIHFGFTHVAWCRQLCRDTTPVSSSSPQSVSRGISCSDSWTCHTHTSAAQQLKLNPSCYWNEHLVCKASRPADGPAGGWCQKAAAPCRTPTQPSSSCPVSETALWAPALTPTPGVRLCSNAHHQHRGRPPPPSYENMANSPPGLRDHTKNYNSSPTTE